VGALTFASGAVVAVVFRETKGGTGRQ
jgi:hypothetical protein